MTARRVFLALAVATLAGATACLGGGATGPGEREGRPVLFVGNSHTYTHDLPLLVEALADSAGAPPLAVTMIVAPGVSLEDHWADGTARSLIAQGGWEVVVLQQGASSRDDSRAQLRDYAARFAAEIRAVGATPALYQVWPAAADRADFPRALESWALAADDVNGLLLPVGAAWLAAWDIEPELPLYGGDGLHASPAGTYLNGLTIFAVLTGRSPVGLPATVRLRNGTRVSVPADVAEVLQAAAAEAVAAAAAPSSSRR